MQADRCASAAVREQQGRLTGQVHVTEQRVRALELARPAAPAATAADLDALRGQLAAALGRLETYGGAGATPPGASAQQLEALRRHVAAGSAEQARLAAMVARLNGVVTAFARAVSAPACELGADSSLALPAPPAPGGQRWGPTGTWGDTGRPLPAVSTSGSLDDAEPALRARAASAAPGPQAARAGAAGTLAGPPSPPIPVALCVGVSVGLRDVQPPCKRPRLGRGSSVGAEGSNVVASPPQQAPASSAPDRPGCSGASAAAPLPDAEVTAAEVVEGWLAGLTRGAGAIGAAQAAHTAAGLQAAHASGACPLPCLLAGFETALLECAAATGPRLEPGPEAVSAAAAAGVCGGASGGGHSWCSQDARSTRVSEWLLRCACDLDKRLRADGHGAGVLEPLRAHFHERALSAAGELRTFETEACAVCAATASLCRLLGSVQARVRS